MTQTYRLDDGHQTLVLASAHDRLPQVVYWGSPLPDGENLEEICAAHAIDVTGGMLDETPDLSLCPEAGRSFPGQAGIAVARADGTPLRPVFHLRNVVQDAGLRLVCAAPDEGLTLTLDFGVDAGSGVITCQTTLEAVQPVRLHWLAAPVMPAPQLSTEMIDVSGRWCGEFQLNRTPWRAGIHARDNRTGRTGHEHFPGLLIPTTGTTNTQGTCYGFH